LKRAMKKSAFMFFVVLLVGLIVGILLGELLSDVSALWFLTKSVEMSAQPKIDLHVFKFDLYLSVKLNLCAILGVIAAFWVYRRL